MEVYEMDRPRLIDVVFASSVVNHFALDIAYGDVVPIRNIYSSLGMIPEDSNVVQALYRKENQIKGFQYLVDSSGRFSLSDNVSDFIWNNLIGYIPFSPNSADGYLSYEVPKSLGGVLEEKLSSLFIDISDSSKIVSFGSSEKDIEGYFNYFMPVGDSSYFMSFKDSEVIIKKKEDYSFSEIKSSFGIEFLDQMMIAYLENFADKKSYDYLLKMEHLLEAINELKSDGVEKSEVWRYII